jgi:hypothetical protein
MLASRADALTAAGRFQRDGGGQVAFRRKLTFLLVLSLFLFVFLGGYHHCCDCYSQSCSLSSHAVHQPLLFSTAAHAADGIQPLLTKTDTVCFGDTIPNPSMSRSPLNGRAPPDLS